ncbi:MAG TPA: RraA family protein [Verrucomicrobiae bacterium]|nr:RraA family protein [Verrucomicrobiae bacterium]
MNAPLTTEELESLRRLNASTLANAIEQFHQRTRNEGFIKNSIHCLFPDLPTVAGYAATVKVRGSAPPTVGSYSDRTDWWDYILSIPAPRLVVVQDVGTTPGIGSLLGAVHVNILRALGCVGAVTNGAVRDLPEAKQLGFQLFSEKLSVSHAYIHIVDFGNPVQIGGLEINSGDLLHGDLHGLQSIPLDIATKVPAVAAEIAAREQELISLCQSRDFSLEKLRAAISQERH